ncbi:MAG: hypothetical protein IPI91_05490 [Flavobacteriales bacterium]|nr:hypothetical protein [Flavobacteriales bacterium]
MNNFNPYRGVALMNIVKQLVLITFLSYITSSGISAQTTWRKAYGAFADEECSAIRKIGTNEFIAVGSTGSFGNGSADIYVVRLGNSGEMVWSVAVGNAGIEHATDAIVTVDDFIYITGYTNSSGEGGYDGYLAKLDGSGNILWEKTYGRSDWDFFNDVALLPDGGLVLTGTTYSYGNVSGALWHVRVDGNGELIWSNLFSGPTAREGSSSKPTADGGFILAGSVISASGDKDALLVKLDAAGNEVWLNSYGGDSLDIAYDVIQTADGGYSMVGSTHSYSVWTEAFHVRTDANGSKQWHKNWGQINDQESFEHCELPNGDFIQVGYTKTTGGGGKDMFMLMSYWNGDFQFGRTFGGFGDDSGATIALLNDGFICGGWTESYGAGGKDMFIVRTDLNGTTQFETVQSNFDPLPVEEQPSTAIAIGPNPNSGSFHYSGHHNYISWTLANMHGQIVDTGAIQDNEQVTTSVGDGIYMLGTMDRSGSFSYSRLVIIHP